jgi:hypothetical protein
MLKAVKDGNGPTRHNMMMRFSEKFGMMLSSGTIYSTLHTDQMVQVSKRNMSASASC